MINENIPHPKLFVIGPDGEQIGVLTRADALQRASDMKMDLVLISVDPKPIAKILDYGKFKYLRSKRKKEEKAKQARVENHQIRLTPFIGDNDIKTKAKKAREFLLDGDIVKVSLKFKGREAQRPEFGHETLMKFYKEVEDISFISKEPILNGKFLDMFLQQDKKKIIQYNKKIKEQQ
ncbi:MAG: translation initiation factor IF-3 [Mycoplasma sp.]|nr:translation initiation factor IF-3 [Mycoplasma sp.]